MIRRANGLTCGRVFDFEPHSCLVGRDILERPADGFLKAVLVRVLCAEYTSFIMFDILFTVQVGVSVIKGKHFVILLGPVVKALQIAVDRALWIWQHFIQVGVFLVIVFGFHP